MSDRGVALLVHTPLLRLRELDLSRTQITAKSLELLPNGSYVMLTYVGIHVKTEALMHTLVNQT